MVWRNSSWVEFLPMMNWMSSTSSMSKLRSRALNAIESPRWMALTKSFMNFSAGQ